jgi:TPR repeat protein
VGGITARFAPNTAHNSSLTAQVAPPDSASGSPSGSNPRIVAEAERELASALNSAQLRPDEIAALLKSGQELIAEGKFRFARLVLERAAEAKSGAAALALARTYDPLVDRPAGRGDAPPDVAMARAWYERAKELGSTEAAQRLNQSPVAAPTPPRPSPK